MGIGDIGAQLRSTREAHGLSLETMAQRTRVQPRILTAIEENDLRSIPPKPFGRGFVRAYAREVGLDPERAVHDYFGQFPAAVPEAPPPVRNDYEPQHGSSWVIPTAGIAVLVLVIAWGLRGGDAATEAATTPDAIGTTGNSAAVAAAREASSAAAVAPAKPAPAPAPAVKPPAATSGLNVELSVNAPTWISASADGKRALYRELPAGSRETLTADREISVLTGNAGGVELTINGRAAGAMGKSGEVRTLRINPNNAASIGQKP